MRRLESEQSSASAPEWEIYPACDVALGQYFNKDGPLHGSSVEVDVKTIQQTLPLLNTRSKAGHVIFLVTASKTLPETVAHPKASIKEIEQAAGLAYRNPEDGNTWCHINVDSMLVDAADDKYSEELSEANMIALHELKHVADYGDKLMRAKLTAYHLVLRASMMGAAALSGIGSASGMISINQLSINERPVTTMALGGLSGLLGGGIGFIGAGFLAIQPIAGKSIEYHRNPFEKAAFKLTDSYVKEKRETPPFIAIKKLPQ